MEGTQGYPGEPGEPGLMGPAGNSSGVSITSNNLLQPVTSNIIEKVDLICTTFKMKYSSLKPG